jgi:ketopantoate reductase
MESRQHRNWQPFSVQNVVGGLCGTFSWVVAPGKIRSISTATFIKFGELDNQRSERIERLRQAFSKTSVKAEIPADIHAAIWEKFLLVTAFGGVGGESGANRYHPHRAGNTNVAATMHGRSVSGSTCEPHTVER